MELLSVYTVCLTFSLLWENQIIYTKLGKTILKFNIILANCAMDHMDMDTKYTNDCVTDFLLLSSHMMSHGFVRQS